MTTNRIVLLFIGVLSGLFCSGVSAQDVGTRKVPPMAVSSEFPFESKYIEVLGSRMHYVDKGTGDPILFLHGNPSSSYLWRNVMPHLQGQGRVIALDNIGFGKSDQPDIDYVFGDHYRYLEDFIKKLGLQNITLVVHDWGSALGLHYAHQNPHNVKGIVTMEAVVAPIRPAKSYDNMLPKGAGALFRILRDPVTGRKRIVDDNFMLEEFLPNSMSRTLDQAAHDVYRAPFIKKSSRELLFQWPSEVPIGGKPATTAKIVGDYNKWLEETKLPWLFVYASPGWLNPPEIAQYWAERAKNIETVYVGRGEHFIQEDQPYAVGKAISDWYRRLEQASANLTADGALPSVAKRLDN